MDGETQAVDVTVARIRPPDYRTVLVDGFDYASFDNPSGSWVQLTATLDDIRASQEKFKAEVVESRSFRQVGPKLILSDPIKVELTGLRLTPKVAVDLAKLLIRQLPDFAPESVELIKSLILELDTAHDDDSGSTTRS